MQSSSLCNQVHFMILESLHLKSFRNYVDLNIQFDSCSNCFLGENGQGKTNLLDAIYFLSVFKSFRNLLDRRMLHFDSHLAVAQGILRNTTNVTKTLRVVLFKEAIKKKIVFLNEKKIQTLPEAVGQLKAVCFAPNDIYLIQGSPGTRRKYMDHALSLTKPNYLRALKTYLKVLQQKNALLKQCKQTSPSQNKILCLEAWNAQLLELGTFITKHRLEFLSFVEKHMQQLYATLHFDFPNISIRHISGMGSFENLKSDSIRHVFSTSLKKLFSQEMSKGNVLCGPHLDDFQIMVQKTIPIKEYGSQGQLRAMALVLKLASSRFAEQMGEKPILLFDDIYVDLDSFRKQKFFQIIHEHQKFFVATSQENFPPGNINQSKKLFLVHQGQITMKTNT